MQIKQLINMFLNGEILVADWGEVQILVVLSHPTVLTHLAMYIDTFFDSVYFPAI